MLPGLAVKWIGQSVVVQFACHPEQAFVAQREPVLSEVEGDLGAPIRAPSAVEGKARILMQTAPLPANQSENADAGPGLSLPRPSAFRGAPTLDVAGRLKQAAEKLWFWMEQRFK